MTHLTTIACLMIALPIALWAQGDVSLIPVDGPPSNDYIRAIEMFQTGDKLTAACLFYRGQYRARTYLEAHPDLSKSGDPALYASLNEVVGRPINEWVAGDVDEWVAAIECALNWSATNDLPETPIAKFPNAHALVTEGLVGLINNIRSSGDEIRAQRAANGLKNR